MIKFFKHFVFIVLTVSLFSCGQEEACDCDAEGIQLFQLVTSDDIEIINNVEGIDVNECIRYNLENIFSDQIDYETVKIVDNCCCK
ncbi:MAG: hypothetical protein CMG04_04245 [Candidatus Marinimicrobia bacterium]|nr:hypothetical protein [Candidatus Neomarinimicrobiota bacterium]MAV69984.1 hypothetical protein [Candidatus Neomarinimicrobiota bacterium]